VIRERGKDCKRRAQRARRFLRRAIVAPIFYVLVTGLLAACVPIGVRIQNM
jgi:hypothetical protein